MVNKTFVEYLIETSNITKHQIIDQFLNLWVSFSRMVLLTFHKEFSEDDYNNLQQNLTLWAENVAKVIFKMTFK